MISEEIYIQNAGLVILNAYLSSFFDRCGLTEDSGFKSQDAAERAAQLLQYVVVGENRQKEEDLVLNKILCGIPVETIISEAFTPSESEKEISEQMLQAIISHWELIKNSSAEGFRESWLWREGKLMRKEKYWELKVEQRPFDVLLDYKPFSISPVSFSWMEYPIKVIWR